MTKKLKELIEENPSLEFDDTLIYEPLNREINAAYSLDDTHLYIQEFDYLCKYFIKHEFYGAFSRIELPALIRIIREYVFPGISKKRAVGFAILAKNLAVIKSVLF